MVKFNIGEGYPLEMFVDCVWKEAFQLCDVILRSPAAKENFVKNADSDFNQIAYDTGIEKTYTVELTTNVDDLNSYADILPTKELTVNFNPLLVINICKEFSPRRATPTASGSAMESGDESRKDTSENTESAKLSGAKRQADGGVPASATKAPRMQRQAASKATGAKSLGGDPIIEHDLEARRRQVVLFLAVKLAHEVWHLVHRQGSKNVQTTNASPERYRFDTVDGTTYTVPYTDIGTLMERDLLGGVWEFTSRDRKHFMSVDAVIIYPSVRAATVGAYLDPTNTVMDSNGIEVRTHGEYRPKTAPKFKGGRARLSAAQSQQDEDEEDEDEDEDEKEELRQPGTGGLDKHGKPRSKR